MIPCFRRNTKTVPDWMWGSEESVTLEWVHPAHPEVVTHKDPDIRRGAQILILSWEILTSKMEAMLGWLLLLNGTQFIAFFCFHTILKHSYPLVCFAFPIRALTY